MRKDTRLYTVELTAEGGNPPWAQYPEVRGQSDFALRREYQRRRAVGAQRLKRGEFVKSVPAEVKEAFGERGRRLLDAVERNIQRPRAEQRVTPVALGDVKDKRTALSMLVGISMSDCGIRRGENLLIVHESKQFVEDVATLVEMVPQLECAPVRKVR